MKSVFTVICIFYFAFVVKAQTSATTVSIKTKQENTVKNESEQLKPVSLISKTDTAKKIDLISLKENEFDFGKIPQGKPVKHVFEFTNISKSALSLNNVQASCGCTTPEWSKDPVAAGAVADINVGYNAVSEGPFTKMITITYNDTQTKQIVIKGEVWKTPVTSAPENSALSTLKNQQ